ncbi:MAG: GAF domain-containing protein [Ferruginibacter sp.]
MTETTTNFQKDIDDIEQISVVPTLLNVICETTGIGFAAIARVTEDKWMTCMVKDDISFGLRPGDELQIKTTICNEVRELKRSIVIDHVKNDPEFYNHHTPAMYGFQSYISVPFVRKDGSFFGTLCAIDPKPHKLNTPAVIGMFNLFADLISFHLNALDEVNTLRSKMNKLNKEVETFAFITSHDLQEPLRKIETFATVILDRSFKFVGPGAILF